MKEIPLTRGRVAIVDDDDFVVLSAYRWTYATRGYAIRTALPGDNHAWGTSSAIMHRQIVNAPRGMDVDHVNGDRLDNRRANLRICTRSENLRNVGRRPTNTSGLKGAAWDRYTSSWKASIRAFGRHIHLGRFKTAEEAAGMYDAAALIFHGDFARPNCAGLLASMKADRPDLYAKVMDAAKRVAAKCAALEAA